MTPREQANQAAAAPEHPGHRPRSHRYTHHDYAAMAAWVKARAGKVVTSEFSRAFNMPRECGYERRRAMLKCGLIAVDDWPVNGDRIIKGREHKVLMAMVRAGATPIEVAGAFRLTQETARRWIRDSWELVELEAE